MAAEYAPAVRRPAPDGERERPAVDPIETAPSVRRREDPRRAPSVDQLMVGAPLTAAVVGMLLAESGLTGVESGEAAGSAGAVPSVDPAVAHAGGAGTEAVASGDGLAIATTDGPAAVGDAGGGTVPVTAADGEAAEVAGRTAPDGSGSEGLAVPGEASVTSGGEAGTIAGASLSITFGGAGDGQAFPLGGSDGAMAADERGDIGQNLQGGAGDDVIRGTDNDDILSGGAGSDEIHGQAGDDLIDGGAGSDLLFGDGGDDRLLGGRGQDEIHGGSGADELLGGAGSDRLFGEAGSDTLVGGAGDDLLDGGAGADRMVGGAGDDTLVIGGRHDVALEDARSADGGGADTVRVGDDYTPPGGLAEEGATFVLDGDVDRAPPAGTNTHQHQLDPDVENVVLTGGADHDVVGDSGANRIVGNGGDNALYGGGGQDILVGGAGADRLDGGAGNDQLRGGGDDDILSGGLGRDRLEGGEGDDILDGGYGADLLYGEGGDDTFVVGLNDRAVDTIFDQEGSNGVVVEGGAGHEVQTAIAGDDLHIVVDHNPIAVIDGYRSGDFAEIDTGNGVLDPASLLAENGGAGPALPSGGTGSGGIAGGEDLLASYLGARSHVGQNGADSLLGTSGADWLTGLDGDDLLTGADGHDILEGGAGSDLLRGGGGDDRYLFSAGESGLDTIRDAGGSNHAELQGFTGARLEGVMVGQDLVVVAHHAPIFVVENFAGQEDSFAGIQNGDIFIPTEDLFA